MCAMTWMRFLATVLGALGFTACTSTKEAFTPPEWLGKETLPAREQPATVSQQTAAELQQQGYVQIGTIRHEVVVATHWGTEPAPAKGSAVTTGLLRKAAELGGDVVVLNGDNKLARRTVTKQVATAWSRESHQELYQDGNYQRSRTVYTSVPTAWRTDSGTEYYTESYGTVWRHDPALLQRAIAWEKDAPERARRAAELAKATADEERKDRLAERRRVMRSWAACLPDRGVFPSGRKVFFDDDERLGYIDVRGAVVIAPKFGVAHPFRNGLALVFSPGAAFIDPSGAVAVEPKGWRSDPSMMYALFHDFADGMARIRVGLSPMRWGYMDLHGDLAIQPQFEDARDFSEGLAAVSVTQQYPRWDRFADWGFIDKTGHFVLPPQFDDAGSFHEGLAWASRWEKGHGKRLGYIDASGQWAISRPGLVAAGDFAEGLAPAAVLHGQSREENWGFIDRTGEWVIQPQFAMAFSFAEGRARVRFGGFAGHDAKYGFIDRTGKLVIQAVYERANDFGDGLAAAWPIWRDETADSSVHTSPGHILDPNGVVLGEIDGLGLVQWRSTPGTSQ